MTFEEKLASTIQQQVIASIHKADLVQINYRDRFEIPSSFLAECWGLIDQEQLKQDLSKRLQEELVERLVNHMAAEIATDIKQVLSVKERREAIRHVVRENIDKLTGGEKYPQRSHARQAAE